MARRTTLLVAGATLVTCVLLIVDLLLADAIAPVVLVGTMESTQLIALLATLCIAAVSVILVWLATGRWARRSWATDTWSVVAVMLIVLAGGLAFIVGAGVTFFIGIVSYTHIDVPGADRAYVIAARSFDETDYQLLEGHGIFYSSLSTVFPLTDSTTDSFATGNYSVTRAGEGWMIHYSSTGTGPSDTTVSFESSN